jgi:predicted GIY-YIG superfamily endonuclease
LRLCPSKPCVYILARKRNGTIDIGVTGGFLDRAALHTQDVDEFRGRDPRGAG